MLVTPFILMAIFGFTFFRRADQVSGPWPALFPTGLAFLIMLSLIQILSNQFGFDRSGFRAMVLSPVPRHEILLAKNLTMLSLALMLYTVGSVILMVWGRVPWLDWGAGFIQFLSAFLILCLLGNLGSIVAPLRVAPGSLKPTKPPPKTVLVLFGFHALLPLVLVPVAIPPVLQLLFAFQGWLTGIPINLVGSALVLGLVVLLYAISLQPQGRLLQSREQQVLQAVTQEVE
jgi:hypothetical protein